jgi:type IV pilus assembly protein PilO
MALDFDVRDPKNQKTIAVVLTVAVILLGFYQFLIKPRTVELANRKAEIATLQGQLNTLRGTLESKKNLLAERDGLNAKLQEVETYLPEKENIANLLDQFNAVENATKVYMVGFKANETVEAAGKPYRANTYKVTVEAGYHQFVEFMGGIMALPRIMSFSELKIAPNSNAPNSGEVNEGLEDQPRSLTVECTITSYVFTGITEAAAKTGETKK